MDIFDDWFEKEKKLSKSGKRKYLHFDNRINIRNEELFFKEYFQNRGVEKHSFYPFIRNDIVTPRYKKKGVDLVTKKPIRERENKSRPIVYAAHFDAIIYSYYSALLNYRYKKLLNKYSLNECVLAYIDNGKSNINHVDDVFNFIKEKGECTAFAFDISSFFDCLDHELLKKMWAVVLGKRGKIPKHHYVVFKSLTKYQFVRRDNILNVFQNLINKKKSGHKPKRICTPEEFRDVIRGNELIESNTFVNKIVSSNRYGMSCGIPQGTPMSACLSNIYMLNFDRTLNEIIQSKGGLYRRYSDDILVVCESNEAHEIKQIILNEIIKCEMLINDEKTEMTIFRSEERGLIGYDEDNQERNLQYLGFEFNGRNVYIRSSSMSRYYKRMTTRIRENLKAAYGKKSIGHHVFRKKLYNRYSSKGERNFISYAKRASATMNSSTIHRQYKASIEKVRKRMDEKKLFFEQSRKISNKKI